MGDSCCKWMEGGSDKILCSGNSLLLHIKTIYSPQNLSVFSWYNYH